MPDRMPPVVGIPPVRLQFLFQSSLGSLPVYDLKKDLACMWDKSNYCSVICALFKITYLRKLDERGNCPFHWPLTSFPDRHTYSVHSVQYCLSSCFEQFCWDLIRTCSFATCCIWRMARTTSERSAWWREALAADILVLFLSLLHQATSLHNTISTYLRVVQLRSNFYQSLSGYIVWAICKCLLRFSLWAEVLMVCLWRWTVNSSGSACRYDCLWLPVCHWIVAEGWQDDGDGMGSEILTRPDQNRRRVHDPLTRLQLCKVIRFH